MTVNTKYRSRAESIKWRCFMEEAVYFLVTQYFHLSPSIIIRSANFLLSFLSSFDNNNSAGFHLSLIFYPLFLLFLLPSTPSSLLSFPPLLSSLKIPPHRPIFLPPSLHQPQAGPLSKHKVPQPQLSSFNHDYIRNLEKIFKTPSYLY